MKSQPCMQDELALVREELRLLQKQRLEEAAKQEPNHLLLDILGENCRQLFEKEKMLMEMDAKRLEAQATGEQVSR